MVSGLGAMLPALLYVYQASTDVSLVELVERPDGRIEEHRPPKRLQTRTVEALNAYGHLFYADARTLERLLPNPRDARGPVVILRLRGHSFLGATMIEVLTNYAARVKEVNGCLYLTGVSEPVHDELSRTDKLDIFGLVRVYEVPPFLGQVHPRRYRDAEAWLIGPHRAARLLALRGVLLGHQHLLYEPEHENSIN